jgi:hypothetical protein
VFGDHEHWEHCTVEMGSDSGGRVLQTTESTAEQRKLLKSLKIETPKLVHHVG